MSLKIRRSTILQYGLIYFMLILNQSHIFRIYINTNQILQVAIMLGLSIFLLFKNFKASQRAIFICIFLILSTMFVRMTQGGIGITICYEMIIKILILYAAILIDPELFLTRFVKVVVFFAGISIIGWIQQIAGLNIMEKIAPAHLDRATTISWEAGYREVTNYYINGLIFYTTSKFEPMRNVGFYTEPGIYQMVLNTAIVILTFFSNAIDVSRNKIKKYLIICVVALITTQSTSGYFGLAVIMLGVVLVYKKQDKSLRHNILLLMVIAIVILIGDWAIRGDISLINKAVLSKVFTDNTQFDINASTGMFRMASITMALEAMIKHPLGLGYSKWMAFSAVNELAGAGGWPFKLGAILGVIPFITVMVWIFRPLKYIKKHIVEIIVIIFLYFNTATAQSSAFYPVLILIPVYLSICKCDINAINYKKQETFFGEE